MRKMRESGGLEQRELAKRIGKSPATVSCYENGSIMPSYEMVEKIAKICNYTVTFEDKYSKEIIYQSESEDR